ncbi:hypothetical protein HDU98_005213 [Podochytrium sp. JEL0797]|nr:hypothetical protein HDU98_005213 [Podochytrium sp. JEL0797]
MDPPVPAPDAPNNNTHINNHNNNNDDDADEVIAWSDDEDVPGEANDKQPPVIDLPAPPAPTFPTATPQQNRAASESSAQSHEASAVKVSKHKPPQLWEPVIADQTVSSYELEREARIAQNRAVLLSLGVLKDSSFSLTGSEEVAEEKKPRKSHKRKKTSDFYQSVLDQMDLKRSKRLQGEGPENIRGGKSSELGNHLEPSARAFSDSDSNNNSDDDDIFDHSGMIGMSKIRKRRLGAGVDLMEGLQNDFIHVEAPFTLGFTKLTVWSVGKIVEDEVKRENYWSQKHCRYRHQYPVGFKATKNQYGYDWTMTIEEGEDGPLFKVVADNAPELPEFTGPSPTSPWTEVCMTVMGKNSKTRVSGPHQFGFTDPFLQSVIFGLPNHPHIQDMTTLRLVSRQARRGLRFGGRDGQKRKRGRSRNGHGLMDELAANVIVVGGMKEVDWEVVLEGERVAEGERREARRVKMEAEEKERRRLQEEKERGMGVRISLKAEELEEVLQQQHQRGGRRQQEEAVVEMMEVEVEVEEEIPESELAPVAARVVNGREFRSRKPPKQFRKVIKKIMMPAKNRRGGDAGGSAAARVAAAPAAPAPVAAAAVPPVVVRKTLTTVPDEILARSQDPEDDVVYCICEYPGSDVWNTVACDYCNIWYHIDCVGYVDPETIAKDQHVHVKGLMRDGRWKCPRCRHEVLLVKV